MLIDPVCAKRIKRNHAHIALDYDGVTYYLCCPNCQADFERAPDQYARAEYGEKTHSHSAQGKLDRHAKELARKVTIVHSPVQ